MAMRCVVLGSHRIGGVGARSPRRDADALDLQPAPRALQLQPHLHGLVAEGVWHAVVVTVYGLAAKVPDNVRTVYER
jgi:hypothetical protein